MGACLGRFFPHANKLSIFRYFKNTGLYHEEDDQIELDEYESEDQNFPESTQPKTLKKHRVPISLELVEDSLKNKSNKYQRLELTNTSNRSLQTLDARILLQHQGCLSSTASSLDLEWEHEVIPLTVMDNGRCRSTNSTPSKSSTHGSQASSLTVSHWSKVSTPNSLEWDPVAENETATDVETEQLLTEIERSTYKTLKETGEWSGVR